jgi:hypothetical protein
MQGTAPHYRRQHRLNARRLHRSGSGAYTDASDAIDACDACDACHARTRRWRGRRRSEWTRRVACRDRGLRQKGYAESEESEESEEEEEEEDSQGHD